MRRVQISDICTRFARYLYSRKQSWIIKQLISSELFLFVVKNGTPTDGELEALGYDIAELWTKLGRCLKVDESKLEEIRQDQELLSDKGYHMLKFWKQMNGSGATYQALFDALKDNLVQRQDLAERFCYFKGNYFLQY